MEANPKDFTEIRSVKGPISGWYSLKHKHVICADGLESFSEIETLEKAMALCAANQLYNVTIKEILKK